MFAPYKMVGVFCQVRKLLPFSRVVYFLRGYTVYVSCREGIGVLKEILVVTGKKTEDTHKFHFFWREIWLQTFKKSRENKKKWRKHRPTRFWLFFFEGLSNLPTKKIGLLGKIWSKIDVCPKSHPNCERLPDRYKICLPLLESDLFINQFPSNNPRNTTSFH